MKISGFGLWVYIGRQIPNGGADQKTNFACMKISTCSLSLFLEVVYKYYNLGLKTTLRKEIRPLVFTYPYIIDFSGVFVACSLCQ